MVSVCGDKQGKGRVGRPGQTPALQGKGRVGRPGQTPAHSRSFLVTPQQWWCLSVWAVPGKFFQSLPIPCGASPDVTDSREKRNQGQSDFLRQKI